MNIRFAAGAAVVLIVIYTARLESKEHWQSLHQSRMTLLVCDLTGIDPQIRSIAKTEVVRIFAASHIDLAWFEVIGGSEPCMISGLASYFSVVLSARPPKGWTSTLDAAGMAPARTGSYPRVYVFYELLKAHVKAFNAANQKSALGRVLAHVIAHEVGHLLIGEIHGTGIMNPQWGYDEWSVAMRGGLVFDPDHANLMHQRLRAKID